MLSFNLSINTPWLKLSLTPFKLRKRRNKIYIPSQTACNHRSETIQCYEKVEPSLRLNEPDLERRGLQIYISIVVPNFRLISTVLQLGFCFFVSMFLCVFKEISKTGWISREVETNKNMPYEIELNYFLSLS